MIDWKLLNEAEDDYIKIGDRVYPRSMAKMSDNKSASDILKDTKAQYEKEQEAERVEKERKDKEESAEKFKEQMIDLRKNVKDENDLDSWFQVFVPRQGKAESLAGEIIRALMRMEYRYHNDGDIFNFGYGLETAGPAYEFLYKKFQELEDGELAIDTLDQMLEIVNSTELPEVRVHYSGELEALELDIIDYLKNNFDNVAVENTEDMLDYKLSKEKEKTFEYDWNVPEDVYDDIDNGLYEPADLFEAFRDYEFELIGMDDIVIENMDFYDYSEAKNYFSKADAWDNLQEYIDELRNN